MIRTFQILFVVTTTLLASSLVSASVIGPLTFNSDNDYDNGNPPANPAPNGLFRDFIGGLNINRGTDTFTEPIPVSVTALNFNSGTGGTNGTTLYDSDPTNSTPSLFTGTIRLSTDFIQLGTNANQPGLVALFNEGAGKQGLALTLSEAGNTDRLVLHRLTQTADLVAGTELTAVSIPNDANNVVTDSIWYRLTMDVSLGAGPITGASNVTVTGRIFTHSDPSAVVGAQRGGTLSFVDTLADLGLDTTGTGQVGLLFDQGANTSKAAFTNFSIEVPAILAASPISGSTIDFGDLEPLDTLTETIDLSNTGTTGSTLSVSSAVFGGPDAALFSFAPAFSTALLTAGGSLDTASYNVQFLGTATPGTYTAILSFATSEGTANFNLTVDVNAVAVESVPEPSTLLLCGSGAIGLLAWGWGLRRRCGFDRASNLSS